MKILVVYYSRTGSTKFAAENIAKQANADLEEIVDTRKRTGVFGFMQSGFEAMREKETRIQEMEKSPKDYDLIAVGTPVWARKMTPAARTYLRHNDFSGKKLALFCTMGDSRNDRIFPKMKELAKNADFAGELALTQPLKNKQETEKQIEEWCKKILEQNSLS
jgi:flavodoxin